MGRKTRRPWKQLQGGSFLHSVRDREGLEELNGPGFEAHCMTLGQLVHLSDLELPHLENGYSK